jgi:rod shape determining protein RodA|tara:strand:+ start:789 stop:1979 length:1191 start_codon:yes stop_codon:yes gene_type:complete
MSQDFVRRLPNFGAGFARSFVWVDKIHLDMLLLLLLMATTCYGLLILYSASGEAGGSFFFSASSEAGDNNLPEAVIAQLMKFSIATFVMLFLAQISPVFYLRLAPWLFCLGLLFLVLVLAFGTEINGSKRWLRIPGVAGFQPSELMKLVVPLMLAWYFHDRHLPPRTKHIFWALVMILVPVLLIANQPDLGTSLVIGAAGLLVLFLAGIRWRNVFGAMIAMLASAPALWFLLKDYQKQRILTMWDPERDPLGAGWNIIQSKTAIGSGGLFGKGLFQGTQSHLDFLPESQTDFIISVLAEELGLFGIVILLILYILLIGRGLIMAVQAQDTFGRLLAGSITFTFFVYVFVNIGMVSGVLPVVGIPLPLVSYGGTSIVTIFAGFGILMSIHTHRRIML